jgi:hypothetical protein
VPVAAKPPTPTPVIVKTPPKPRPAPMMQAPTLSPPAMPAESDMPPGMNSGVESSGI